LKSEKILGIVLIYIVIPVFAILLVYSLTLGPYVQENEIIEFNSNWKFFDPATGKSGVVDLPAFIDVPGNAPVRLTHMVPDYDISNLALFFMTRQQKVKVYLDDELIYDFGSEPKYGWYPGNSFHFISLRENCRNSIITIELTSPSKIFSGLVNSIHIGSRDALLLNLIKKDILPLIFSLLILILGMILFFLFSLMSFFKINDSGTFYLALFSIFGGLWMTSDRILTLLFFNDPVFNLNICYMSMYLLPVPFLLYIKSICRLKRNRLLDLLSWLFLLFALSSAIMQLLNIIDFTTVLPVFHLMSLATAVCVCTIFYKETKKGKKPPVIFMISCVALFSFLLLDLVLFYASYIYKIDYFGYFQISMLLFIVINIGNLGENLFLIRDMNIKNRLLLSLAYTDTLTRLKNRTSFDEMMNAINNRLKQESSVHLIILDINNLKTINDTYGHKRGDDILVESAKILKVTIGQLGDVYRIGGDEFACIIRNTDESVINEYVSEMFEQVDSFNSKNEQPKLSIAYGMATCHPELDKDIHSLFVRADKAMYNNKETQKVIQVVV